MLSSRNPKDLILDILVIHKHMSAQDLHQRLADQYSLTLSSSQLYYILKQMTDEYLLVKNKTSYSLSQYRIDSIIHYADILSQQPVQPPFSISLTPGYYKILKWTTISAMETQRYDLVSTLINLVTEPKQALFYTSHNYRALSFNQESIDFYSHLQRLGRRVTSVFGSHTPLDLYAQKIFHIPSVKDIYLRTPTVPLSGYNVCVIGPMIVEDFFDPLVTAQLDRFFDTRQEGDFFDAEGYRTLFDAKGSFKRTIKYDPQQADYRRSLYKG